jgi:hypothetical protein
MMNTMKKLLLAAVLLATTFFTGCKDECKDVTCVNGECTEGDCICSAGYTGADCSTALNLNFNGSYSTSQTCDITNPATYTVAVAPKAGEPGQATFTRLFNSPNDAVTAVIAADALKFSIAKQDLGTSGYDIESTNGTISADGKSINLTFKVYIDDTTFLQNCSVAMTR